MADATLTRSEVSLIRRLVGELGLGAAATLLSIHPATLSTILAGRMPRRNTITVLRAKLAERGTT